MPKLFIFERKHDLWLFNHAGGIPHDVDTWAYTPFIRSLTDKFRRKFDTRVSEGAVHKRLIKLRKRRFEQPPGTKRLTKFQKCKDESDVVKRRDSLLRTCYARELLPLDKWSYSAAFDRTYAKLCSVSTRGGGKCPTKHQVLCRLYYLRKKGADKGGLPRISRKATV